MSQRKASTPGDSAISYYGFGPQRPPHVFRWGRPAASTQPKVPRRAWPVRAVRGGARLVRAVCRIDYRRYAAPVLGLLALLLLVVLASVLDLVDDVRPGARANNAGMAFHIGPASQYRETGVYHDFVGSQGVYLVSDHGMLVALDAKSPEAPDRTLLFDRSTQQFRCPRTNARYTRDGLPLSGSHATRAMERCYLRGLGPDDDPDTHLIVDPNPDRRYRFEDNRWSNPFSARLFADQL